MKKKKKSDIFPIEEAYETGPLSDMRHEGDAHGSTTQHNKRYCLCVCVCAIIHVKDFHVVV